MADENGSTPKRDFRQEVTGTIIRMLEAGTAPWQKPWEARKLEMPNNPTTEKRNRGGNAIHLVSVARSGAIRPALADVQAGAGAGMAGTERREGNAN